MVAVLLLLTNAVLRLLTNAVGNASAISIVVVVASLVLLFLSNYTSLKHSTLL